MCVYVYIMMGIKCVHSSDCLRKNTIVCIFSLISSMVTFSNAEMGSPLTSGSLQTPPSPLHSCLPLTSHHPCNHWILTSASSNRDLVDCNSLPLHLIGPRGCFFPLLQIQTLARGSWCQMEEQGAAVEEFLLGPCFKFLPLKIYWLKPQHRTFQQGSAKVVSVQVHCMYMYMHMYV